MRRYGMIVGKKVGNRLYRIEDVIEKPDPEQVTSDLAAMGRYVFRPSLFDHLRDAEPTLAGEVQLADGLRALCQEEEVLAYEYRGERYDLGSKLDWILANVRFGLRRDDLGPELLEELRSLISQDRGQ